MFLVSSPQLVISACLAGIVGTFPTPNVRSVEALDAWMGEVVRALDSARAKDPSRLIAPWAVNLVTHSTNTRLAADLEVVAKYKPPIVITALGSPKPAIPTVHAYGGIVIADVINLTLARKAVAAGVDGLACVAAGAGGHTGSLSPFAFVSSVREFFDGIIIIGGGIGDGWGVAGAIAAGADLVYIGTRFIPSVESIAAEEHKDLVVQSSIDDLVVSSAVTGAPVSWLRPSLERSGYDLGPMDGRKAVPNYDSNAPPKKRWKEIFSAGQGLGQARSIEPVAAIVDRLEAEFRQATDRFLSRSNLR